jgi:hypothetical protein
MLVVLVLFGNRFDEPPDRFALPCTCLYLLSSCLLQLAQYLRPCPFRRLNDALSLPTRSRSGLSQYSLSHYGFMADTHKSPLPRDLSSLNSSPLLPLSSKQAPLTGSCQQTSRPFFNITCKDGQNLPTKINPQKVHPRGKKNNCGCQNVETCDSGVYISSSISSVSHVNSEKAIQRHKPTISRTKDPA